MKTRINPFRYATTLIPRRSPSAIQPRYSLYRDDIQREFGRQCVYCREVDQGVQDRSFEIDHYRPTTTFPKLEHEYRNLYWACRNCNNRKRHYWPTRADRIAGRFVPNPSEHVMAEHARYVDGRVVAQSEAGKQLLRLLDVNSPGRVARRIADREAIRRFEAERAGLLKAIVRGRRLLRRIHPSEGPQLTTSLARLEQQVRKIDDMIEALSARRPT